MTRLGERMLLGAFSVRGDVTEAAAERITDAAVAALGMTPALAPVLYRYPVGGKGGEGFTRIQPITESFVAVDAWPGLGGAYLVVCSCLHFPVDAVLAAVRGLGFEVTGAFDGALSLTRPDPRFMADHRWRDAEG